MQFESKILEAYERLKFKPRDKQVEHINRILEAFLIDEARHVILSAPTGTGKSIIGAVAAEALHQLKNPGIENNASFLLTATNVLGQQYYDTFSNPDDQWDTTFRFIKGANNYECSALSTEQEPQTAESCAIRIFQKSGMDEVIQRHCNGCNYFANRQLRDKSRHLITNYSYYFTDRLALELLAKRTLCVWDEAHLLNDLYTDHCAIAFSEKGLLKTAQEVNDGLRLGSTDIFKHLKMVGNHLAAGKIDESNYQTYIRVLADVYGMITEAATEEAQRSVRQPAQYLKMNRMSKKYFGLMGKILDFLENEYAHVFEYKEKNPKTGQNDHEVSVKPIFVSSMFEKLVNADHNLLMSATISEQYARRTLTLEPEDKVKHIRLEPHFPRDNKKVVFFKPMTLNFNSMKDEKTIKTLCANVYQIVEHHSRQNQRGIILAPSFKVVQSLAGTIRGVSKRTKVFEHIQGDRLVNVLTDFKDYSAGPAVLITPSGFEGVDLPGELSRYTIVVKAPFGSLGDKRIKTILDTYPDIYSLVCLMKIVQGAGRSVRSVDDHAVTYMLDNGIQRLWAAKNNEWADEFRTSYSSILQDD